MTDEGSLNTTIDSVASTALSGTTEELFRLWAEACSLASSPTASSLRHQAKAFFTSLVQRTQFVTEEGRTIRTQSSHEEALALLLQELPWNHSLRSKLRALETLQGAMEACPPLSTALVQTLGRFLLEHCGPLDIPDDDDDDDLDEQVRDGAVQVVSVLVGKISHDHVSLVISLARDGVERRCASSDREEEDELYGSRQRRSVHAGLSLLPRSRRSLCFALLQAAMLRLQVMDWDSADEELRPTIVDFVHFVTTCIHGESDPRCLLQLLQLLHSTQVAAAPLGYHFPVQELIDAIAPYYPIQFTPPPHNPHGITRQALRSALMDLLACRDSSLVDRTIRHSVELVLEGLVPPPGDGPATSTELRDGMDDLTELLLGQCHLLDESILNTLGDTLVRVHDQTSLAVAQGGDAVSKEAADKCRDLVALLAVECEQSPKNGIWDALVGHTLRDLSSRLASSAASQSRTAVAFMACLCASGGPQTLRRSLQAGLRPLLDNLLSGLQDDNDLATAAFGIGAFFSSCRVALDKATTAGVFISPHPLADFSAIAFDKLSSLGSSNDVMVSVRTAAVRAIESIVLSSPSGHFGQDHIGKLERFLETLVEKVSEDRMETSRGEEDYLVACSETIGRFLGTALGEEPSSSTLLTTVELKAYAEDSCYTTMLSTATGKDTGARQRVLKALAVACKQSRSFSERLVSSVLQDLVTALDDRGSIDDQVRCTEVIRSLVDDGGSSPALAAQSSVLIQVLDQLSAFDDDRMDEGMEARFRTSMLELPETDEEHDAATLAVLQAKAISKPLLSIYKQSVSTSHLVELSTSVMRSFPPLKPADTVRFCTGLPFLATALQSWKPDTDAVADLRATLESAPKELIEFAMSSEYDVSSRSQAASCLGSILAKLAPRPSELCRDLVVNTVLPSLQTHLKQIIGMRGAPLEQQVSIVSEHFSLLGILAASAHDVTLTTFLMNVACNGQARTPYAEDSLIDLHLFDQPHASVSQALSCAAASAWGAMLGELSLWQQRISYQAVRKGESLGNVMLACHCLCAGASLGVDKTKVLAEVIGRGIVLVLEVDDDLVNTLRYKKLLLGALIKLVGAHPLLVADNVYALVVGVLRLYVSDLDLVGKLLALEVLESVTKVQGRALESLRPAVVAILGGAMNDPVGVLRSAAVEVRNAWYVVGE